MSRYQELLKRIALTEDAKASIKSGANTLAEKLAEFVGCETQMVRVGDIMFSADAERVVGDFDMRLLFAPLHGGAGPYHEVPLRGFFLSFSPNRQSIGVGTDLLPKETPLHDLNGNLDSIFHRYFLMAGNDYLQLPE